MKVPTKDIIKSSSLTLLVILFIIKHCDSLNNRHKDQEQSIQSVLGDNYVNSDNLFENSDKGLIHVTDSVEVLESLQNKY